MIVNTGLMVKSGKIKQMDWMDFYPNFYPYLAQSKFKHSLT